MRTHRVTRALLLLCAVLVSPRTGRTTETGALTRSQRAAIDSLVRGTMTRHQAPGASFAIGLGGRVAWEQGYGLADVENQVRATPHTAYRSASIGKSMTATAAWQLSEQGNLDLDAPIQNYCPTYPAKPWPISARQLITHTSGIRHYEGPNADAEAFNLHHYDRVSDALEKIAADTLVMRPGTDFHYTTWGYVVLGCVIEGASREDYVAHMRRAIFEPAGMTETRDDDPRAIIPNRARGYVLDNGVLRNSRWSDMSSKMAAGGWLTTAPDLIRFMIAWMDGKLVSHATMTAMLEPCRLADGSTVDQFGQGWFIDDYHGMKSGTYGGGTAQVSAVVFFVPEKRLAVAGLFNLEGIPGPERIALAERIADVVLGEKTPNPDHFTPR
jgi:CubicO group peptidase (beta-lactamase class C family)